MPYEVAPPNVDFLRQLQAMTKSQGALFILDEIRSGFRIELGGAQKAFNLDPDLSTFSKAMANGHALSALVGKRTIMSDILKLGLSVTYYRSPDAMAAALATIDILQAEEGPKRLAMLGGRLFRGLDEAIASSGLPARTVGLPATPFLEFDYDQAHLRARAMRLFCAGMLHRGVLMAPAHHWFVCTSMSENDIDQTVAAAAKVLSRIEAKL